MFDTKTILEALIENWHIWLATVTLIVAALIDGLQLEVPNWITFPMVISGVVFSFATFGLEGLAWSLIGTAILSHNSARAGQFRPSPRIGIPISCETPAS